MDVLDIQRKAEVEDQKKILIFNPLKEDFQGKWDRQELPEYLIPSMDNKLLKTSLANHFGETLIDLYISDKKNYSREQARKLIFPE